MLRIVQSANAAGAARYYTEGLKRADYYSRGQELDGTWHGELLNNLGLVVGEVETSKQFTALLSNKHPITGKQLTPRMNAEANRIPGWDFVFSLPKSISLFHAVSGEESLIHAFRESVRETMGEIEKRIATRVRIGGSQDDRVTGNFAWAEFLHDTTRPLSDGLPDPHLHIHAYVFNITNDAVEDRFKAAKIREIKDNAYFWEAWFEGNYAQKLEALGYPVTRTAKGWELAGMESASLLKPFSRRTDEVESLAKELGITSAKAKDQLGATSRKRKEHRFSRDELVEAWKSRLSAEGMVSIQRVADRSGTSRTSKPTVEEALVYAESKHFEKASVVDKNRIVASALKFGIGAVTPESIEVEMKGRHFIERIVNGDLKVTTAQYVAEEALLVQRVRESRGTMAPLIKGKLKFLNDELSDEQREAARHLLKSNDQVIALRGIAGAGKTTLLKEVREQLAREGIRLIALAVTVDASRTVLRSEGFHGANTISAFLGSKEMQLRARGQVILIDESGTIPNDEMRRLLDIAGKSTKILLSGITY